jgi:hypothetical protein
MHHLKDTQYLPDYTSDSYKGPARKLGAGIQGFDGMAAAHAQNKVILAGTAKVWASQADIAKMEAMVNLLLDLVWRQIRFSNGRW